MTLVPFTASLSAIGSCLCVHSSSVVPPRLCITGLGSGAIAFSAQASASFQACVSRLGLTAVWGGDP